MRAFWKRRKALIGYLFIVAVSVFAVELHQLRVTSDLNERDRRSCEQRNILATNQQLVLGTLTAIIEVEQAENEHTREQDARLDRNLNALSAALAASGPRPC